MPVYDLGIKHSYVPHWGVAEGIREFVQNYLDGKEDRYGSGEGSLKHDGKCLILTNEHTELERSAWILGQTSKAGRDDQRGQWGDGLKTGSLALVRKGISVQIDNGSERWTPQILPSEQFGGVETLHVNIRKLKTAREHFQARIAIDLDTWKDLRRNFLSFCKTTKIVVAGHGSILTDEDMRGRIYARGIYVTTDNSLDYGYDFNSLELDRDRGRIASWELNSAIGYMEAGALTQGDLTVQSVYDRLASGRKSLDLLPYRMRGLSGSTEIYAEMAEIFKSMYGDKSRPVLDEGQATKLAFVGIRGVVVNSLLLEVLSDYFGDFEKIRRDAINTAGTEISIDTLPESAQATIRRAFSILELAIDEKLAELHSQVKIWDFEDTADAPAGLFLRHGHGDYEIRINQSELESLPTLLATLIHELAHRSGSDGSALHCYTEEKMWQSVVCVLLDFLGESFID